MIARVWHGIAAPETAHDYLEHLRQHRPRHRRRGGALRAVGQGIDELHAEMQTNAADVLRVRADAGGGGHRRCVSLRAAAIDGGLQA